MNPRALLSIGHWATDGSTSARGQAWDVDKFLRAEALARRFDALPHDAWPAAASRLNGSFAAVRTTGDSTAAVVDRLRSIPLFFASTAGGLLVADTAQALMAHVPKAPLDPVCAQEFHLTGYVTGAQTLATGLWQLPSGHSLVHRAGQTAQDGLLRYYAFRHADFSADSESALIDRLASVHEHAFQRLRDDVGDRPLAIPLSGGYDSRLIGVMLRDLGFRNVLCYTYGTEGNWEAAISRELAAHLGFRWAMVPYSPQRWRAWSGTQAFSRYFAESGNRCASPHFQDWPAVHELKADAKLAPDAVFVPGHSGDFVAGSHVPRHFATTTQVSREAVLEALFASHYSLWDWPEDRDGRWRNTMASRIEAITGPLAAPTPEAAADMFEAWDCAERQAKFIVNSVRVYESFGHTWRLPLFDTELMDFWSRVPLHHRVGRSLYFAYVAKYQQLPVRQANTDHPAMVAAAIDAVSRSGLRPLAKRAQRVLRKWRWQHEYAGGSLGWLALVEPAQFRERYTGREIGHSFFAAQYLDLVGHNR